MNDAIIDKSYITYSLNDHRCSFLQIKKKQILNFIVFNLKYWVIYYIIYSILDLIKQNVKYMNISWIFHIDDVQKNNINYTRLQLVVQELEGKASTVQWLYINPENRQLYE